MPLKYQRSAPTGPVPANAVVRLGANGSRSANAVDHSSSGRCKPGTNPVPPIPDRRQAKMGGNGTEWEGNKNFQPSAGCPFPSERLVSLSNLCFGGPQPGMSQSVSKCLKSQKTSQLGRSPTRRSRPRVTPAHPQPVIPAPKSPCPQPVIPAQAGISAFHPSHLPPVRPEPFKATVEPINAPVESFNATVALVSPSVEPFTLSIRPQPLPIQPFVLSVSKDLSAQRLLTPCQSTAARMTA